MYIYNHLQILIRGCHPQDFVHLVFVTFVRSENSVQATLSVFSWLGVFDDFLGTSYLPLQDYDK